jgi:hypothetical protein
MRKLWPRVDSEVGHEKNFDIKCEFCDKDMFLRYSQISFLPRAIKFTLLVKFIRWAGKRNRLVLDPRGRGEPRCNEIEYKCSLCGHVVLFSVYDTVEYLNEILKRRKGIPLYYPPTEEWASVDEIHRKKLESLGYL